MKRRAIRLVGLLLGRMESFVGFCDGRLVSMQGPIAALAFIYSYYSRNMYAFVYSSSVAFLLFVRLEGIRTNRYAKLAIYFAWYILSSMAVNRLQG